MTFLPCRVCGTPITGSTGNGTKSFCCSNNKCIKEDTGTNKDESKVRFNDKKWKARIAYLTRGY